MMSDEEFEKFLKKWGAKQVESFWINSIIELTSKQKRIINEEIINEGKHALYNKNNKK